MTSYKLHIYGQVNMVQEERIHFETLTHAVESVEGRVTDDHNGWELKDGKLVLVDHNGGGPNVFHTIKESVVDRKHVKVHDEPIFHPL